MKMYDFDISEFYCCKSRKEAKELASYDIFPVSKEEFLFWIKYYYISTDRLKAVLAMEVDE
ncbi:MAG: hypothetical protein WCO84_01570 [bacterium]